MKTGRAYKTLLLLAFALLCLLVGMTAIPTTAAPPNPGSNLLQNPSFEGLAGWRPWYYEQIVPSSDRHDKHGPDLQQSYFEPDFLTSEFKWDKETRGENEEERTAGKVSARQYTKFRAGYYQTVYVAPGSRVIFTIWANGLCEDEFRVRCPVLVRAGIDPSGGTDWRSPTVHWVEAQIGDQEYKMLISPEVQVPSGRVTVFTWGEPSFPVIYTAAYFDEANLIVTVPPTPTGAAPTPPPTPTVASCAAMQLVSDASMADSLVVTPGARFSKTWRIKNSGSCAWSGTLNFVGSGDRMGGPDVIVLPQLEMGQDREVSIDFVAPTKPGSYQGTWEIRANDGATLGSAIVSVKVAEATPAPPSNQQVQQNVAASPEPLTSQICVLAFDDQNGDGRRTAEESLLAGATFQVQGPSRSVVPYITDGAHEPYCFANLQPGLYSVSMDVPQGYRATTPSRMAIILLEDSTTDLALGAVRAEVAATATATQAASSGGARSVTQIRPDNTRRIALTTVAVLVLVNLISVAFVAARRL